MFVWNYRSHCVCACVCVCSWRCCSWGSFWCSCLWDWQNLCGPVLEACGLSWQGSYVVLHRKGTSIVICLCVWLWVKKILCVWTFECMWVTAWSFPQSLSQSGVWQRVNTQVPVRSPRYAVFDLTEGKQYQFRVLAANMYGSSEASEPTKPIHTLELKGKGIPSIFLCSPLYFSLIHCLWLPYLPTY